MDYYRMIRYEFELNGITKDLDDFDLLKSRSRWQATSGVSSVSTDPETEQRMQRAIEKVRKVLSNLRPLPDRQFCVFCKSNKEQSKVYTTHLVKDHRGQVTCPILAKYTCPSCGATGSKAHTKKYCPFYDGVGTVDSLFRTPCNESGKHRHIGSISEPKLQTDQKKDILNLQVVPPRDIPCLSQPCHINNYRRWLATSNVSSVPTDPETEQRMQQAIEKVRKVLSNLRPLPDRQFCVFCKSNKEQSKVYTTHLVKDHRGQVTCPILAKYTCPSCGATGSKAHTKKYCPFYDGVGTVDSLFRTPRNGSGKHRHTGNI